jgi:VWFA-related protein
MSLALPVIAQTPAPGAQAENELSAPVPTLQTFSRMVTLELVVTDAKGHHVNDLKAGDFKIFEQAPGERADKHEQKISTFKEVRMADMVNPVAPEKEIAPGTFTNALHVQKDPAPATIILVDGLNTEVQFQAQVHMQMMHMLRTLPSNVPVAVFLLGDRLRMLQNFTTDPRLLQIALSKTISTAGQGLAQMDTRDDSSSPSNVMAQALALTDPSTVVNSSAGPTPAPGGGLSSTNAINDPVLVGMVELAKEFDIKVYSSTMDERIHRTFDALISLGHNVAGYPGRKNLLWLSTTFPINVIPIGDNPIIPQGTNNQVESVGDAPGVLDPYSGYRNYQDQLRYLNSVLSDAKISVYPVNIAGVQTVGTFRAEAAPPDISATAMQDAINRSVLMRGSELDTMQTIADGTGGKVCAGDNDLGDCIHKALDDSSDFYEISYYPDSTEWNGEFRKIVVKAGAHNIHLSYRQGYFANPEGGADSKAQAAELRSDCDDYLDATSIPFAAKSVPASSPEDLDFSIKLDPTALTYSRTADGGREMNAAFAVCTFNEKGWPMRLMNYPVHLKMSAGEYSSMLSSGALWDSIRIPGPRPAAVRLLVKDIATGKLGSVYIKTDDLVAAVPPAAPAEQAETEQ